MPSFHPDDLTYDAFLGGKLHLWQPRKGYRAGVDPVLLAATVPAVPGQRVLELGCGAGAASLCLGARVPELSLTGVEVQPAYAELARRNHPSFAVFESVLSAIPLSLLLRHFYHVFANPPYFFLSSSIASHFLSLLHISYPTRLLFFSFFFFSFFI